jgi:hypothetical protein
MGGIGAIWFSCAWQKSRIIAYICGLMGGRKPIGIMGGMKEEPIGAIGGIEPIEPIGGIEPIGAMGAWLTCWRGRACVGPEAAACVGRPIGAEEGVNFTRPGVKTCGALSFCTGAGADPFFA